MALTAEKLFVTEEMFKAYTQVNGSLDWLFLKPQIITVQDQYLQRYLGTALYAKLKTDFNAWSGNYLVLVDTYVRKVVIWWAMKESLPNLRVKVQNGTLTIYAGDDFQSATESDMKRLVDQALKNAQHYTQLMVDYLEYNASLFTEYSSNTGIQRPPSKVVYTGVEFAISRGIREENCPECPRFSW